MYHCSNDCLKVLALVACLFTFQGLAGRIRKFPVFPPHFLQTFTGKQVQHLYHRWWMHHMQFWLTCSAIERETNSQKKTTLDSSTREQLKRQLVRSKPLFISN